MSEEGIRLAKRVAAQQGCSRREAEALIVAGAVRVAGETVTDPARRVPAQVPLRIGQGAGGMTAMTVLLHKPAGMPSAQALRQAWNALDLGPSPATGLLELHPLPEKASGLSVWTNERPMSARLQDRDRPLEMEWRLTLPMVCAEHILAQLQANGIRTSLGHQREAIGQWRLVEKGNESMALAHLLDASQIQGDWALHRQRIGRLGLSPLTCGQARLRLDFEKF